MRAEGGLFAPADVSVGQDVGGREIVVSADDVARYRAGTGAADLPDDPVPALLYHSEVYRDLSWYLPNLLGNLHARQEWECFAPMRLGERVRSRTTVVDRYRKRNRDYVVAEVVWTTPEGRWLQRSRTHQSFLVDLPETEVIVDRERERRVDRRFDIPTGGDPIAPRTRQVTHEMCVAFSGPGRNYHTDVEMARALGFPDIVVQGMWTVCLVADMLAMHYGAGWLAGGKLDVRLVNVVWPRDEITAQGLVRETVPEGSRRRALLDVWCPKADGTVALIGTASAIC